MRAWILIALVGCEHGQTPDTAMDAPRDGFIPADVISPCGNDVPIQGELIDWDSSDDNFLGVFDASITQVGGDTFSTPPNGRLMFCASSSLPLSFTLDSPGDYLDGTISIDANVPEGLLRPLSFRAFTATRAASFFTERSLTFDPNAAQVIVVQTGDASSLTLSGTHGTAQQGNDPNVDGNIQWSVGSAGRYVLFPNVAPAAGGLQLDGDPLGPRTVPAVAGQITLVAISFIFL